MLTGAIAKEQIRDRIETASAERTARAIPRRDGRVRAGARSMGSGLASLVQAVGRVPAPRRGTSPA